MQKGMLTIAMTVLGLIALCACSPTSSDVPSLGTVPGKQVVEDAGPSDDLLRDNEAKMMVFTQCMREHGVELLDPVVDSEGNVQKPEFAEGAELTKSDKGNWEACSEHLEGFTWEKERVDASEQVDQAVAMAECLRAKGYDIGDPTAETLERLQGDFKNTIDWKNPAAVADYEQCSGVTGVGGERK